MQENLEDSFRNLEDGVGSSQIISLCFNLFPLYTGHGLSQMKK